MWAGKPYQVWRPNIFKPENDLKRNIWFSVNLKDVKTLTGVQFNNFISEAVNLIIY